MSVLQKQTSRSRLEAVLPAQPPPPFPDPLICSARRVTGAVLSPPPAADEMLLGDDSESNSATAPSLERRSSVAGNILLVDYDVGENETNMGAAAGGDITGTTSKKKAYLLQRKIKDKVFGIVRVGYQLKHPAVDGGGGGGMWEVVAPSISGIYPHEMVAVTVEEKSRVLSQEDGGSGGSSGPNTSQDPKTELSALQMVAAHDPEGIGHLIGTSVIAADQMHIYTITPYHKDGSLYEYCSAAGGTLSENDSRFFFRQILKGLESLKGLELCHRNLSLENVRLRGNRCTLMSLTNALRIPYTSGTPSMIEPQPPCASNPLYVAPELLRDEPFDGYAVDLWSAAIMLYLMLLGPELLFVAPVMEDRTFHKICVDGNLRQALRKRAAKQNNASGNTSSANNNTITEEAIDLLQGMLRADPKARMTLPEVQQHPWVLAGDANDPPPALPVRTVAVPET